jgi:hypothetical protein
MSPQIDRTTCTQGNFFSDVLSPSVERALPKKGSLASRVLDHSTRLPTFLDTVSEDLCDDGRMSSKSGRAALGFITRSSTTAIVAGGALTLGSIAVATAGAPVAVAGLGFAGLAFLPPVVEWGANKVADFFGGLLTSISRESKD